jgi:hypothetical protein
MKNEFTALDIFKALKIPRERLRAWMKLGFITPTVPAAGQGIKAVFTLDDVYGVSLFCELVENGFSRKVAGNFVKEFREQVKKEKGSPSYPKTTYIMFRWPGKTGKEFADVSRLGSGAWKFDIESGYIDWPLSNPKFKLTGDEMRVPPRKGPEPPPYKDKNWRNIHMVNFETLCKEVDAALAKL